MFSPKVRDDFYTTYDQTVILHRPDTTLTFTAIHRRPTPHTYYTYNLSFYEHAIAIQKEDNTIFEWWPSGLVRVIYADNVKLEFWPKPTLQFAIEYRNSNKHHDPPFFKFNKDGSVYAKLGGTNFYWGPTLDEYRPEVGTELVSVEADDGTWIFEKWKPDPSGHLYQPCGCRC